jgi:hypothetical protein
MNNQGVKNMTSIATSASNLYALLIGVDCYLPPTSPGGVSMNNLAGCVRDINHVEAFLKNTLQLSDSNLLKLTASNAPNYTEPAEPKEVWPTYENMVAKFQEITEKAQPNDRVYIHYSGHGAQAKTIYPHLKGEYALDETLVPTDISCSDTRRYLRDVELALLMQKMVDKGLIVTLVLDSCHSGGAARSDRDDEEVRGVDIIDMTPRPTYSLVAPMEELIQHWKNSNKKSTQDEDNSRNINSKSWLPEPNGYVLIAACRDNESAYERIFEGNERNGALTYWLLKSLRELGTGTSAKVLHERILAKINTADRRQTPMLQGECDRSFFGNNITTLELTASIRQFDVNKNRVELSVGQAHGVRKGSEFALYQLGTTDLTKTDRRIAFVQITQLGAVKSWAIITQVLGNSKIEDIEAGAPALLLYPNLQLVRKVGLGLPQQHERSLGIEPTVYLNAVEGAIETGKGWVELASGDEVADYQIYINSAGEYEILDKSGIAIANLRPTLKVNDPNAAVRLVKRLVHLSKYSSVLALKNHDPMSPLQGKIKVELYPVPDDYEPGEPLTSKPFNPVDHLPILEVGQSAILRIKNESFQSLNIAVLVIQPDWSIKHGYPGGAAFHPLQSAGEILWKIEASLPEGCEKGEDVLKVFATVDGSSFDWLELPPLDTAIASKNPQAATTALEKFFATFLASEDAPPQRNINSAASASTEWTTEHMQLMVKRGDIKSG